MTIPAESPPAKSLCQLLPSGLECVHAYRIERRHKASATVKTSTDPPSATISERLKAQQTKFDATLGRHTSELMV
jgi:hypothetical protein